MAYLILMKPSLLMDIETGNANSGFPKKFLKVYTFAFPDYLGSRSPQIRTKNFKNYTSILTIVNLRNRLNASPPVNLFELFCVWQYTLLT